MQYGLAVLPETAQQSELALLELRLQMQKELKEEYSLTNELLFVEEMYEKHKMPAMQIAARLAVLPRQAIEGRGRAQAAASDAGPDPSNADDPGRRLEVDL